MPTDQSPFARLIVSNLRVGSVIYKHCDFTTPPKVKYMVVASLEPNLLVLMINSEINRFYIDRGLDHFHVPVSQVDHQFLDYDSYANCIEAHNAFNLSDIRQELIDNYTSVFKGWITDECLESVYHAVKGNNMIRRNYQREIISAIEDKLPHLHTAF